MGEMLAGAPFQWLQRTNFWQEIKSLAWGKKRPRSGETRQRFDPPMNEVAMRFLGTATIVGPIVLIILTIWVWFAFGTRAHALADNRRPTPWGWQCSRCPYRHPGHSAWLPGSADWVLSGIWRLPHRYLRRQFGTRLFQAPPTGSYQEYGGSPTATSAASLVRASSRLRRLGPIRNMAAPPPLPPPPVWYAPLPGSADWVLSGIWRLPHRYLRRQFGTRLFQAPPTGSYQEYGGSPTATSAASLV